MNHIKSFKDSFIDRALKSPVRIHLPEINDSRIQLASDELVSLGFRVISYEDLISNRDKYSQIISEKKFSLNWTDDMKEDFLDSYLNFGFVALENNDVDCLIAGADHSTSAVLKSAIRLIGVESKSKWISSSYV